MIEIKNVGFIYDNATEQTNNLRDINLHIERGECIVLCGKSGCGKTTLTRIMNGLIPHYYEGEMSGEITIDGQNIAFQPLAKTASMVGSVFQNPRSQFFNVDTTGEIAFGCENAGMPKAKILERIDEAAELFELDSLLHRSIFELSGGEKQRIACASVYAVHPDVFVLDEPSSNLDPRGVSKLKTILETLKSNGKTIVISEHRLHYLTGVADRFVYMEKGEIKSVFTNNQMSRYSAENTADLGLRTINLSTVNGRTLNSYIEQQNKTFDIANLHCKFANKTVLNIESLQLASKEIIAVIGHNGAGKSTFAGCFCGITKHKGCISYAGMEVKAKKRLQKSYMVMQDVNHQLFTESVEDEVTLNIPEERKAVAENVLHDMGIGALSDSHPLSLSGGQKQRVAIAGAVCAGKEFLIFDEPTSGLDFESMRSTCSLICKAAEDAQLTLVITHDLEFILECCTFVLQLSGGTVEDYYPLDESGVIKVKKHFNV